MTTAISDGCSNMSTPAVELKERAQCSHCAKDSATTNDKSSPTKRPPSTPRLNYPSVHARKSNFQKHDSSPTETIAFHARAAKSYQAQPATCTEPLREGQNHRHSLGKPHPKFRKVVPPTKCPLPTANVRSLPETASVPDPSTGGDLELIIGERRLVQKNQRSLWGQDWRVYRNARSTISHKCA
jgi:hypothetical protein